MARHVDESRELPTSDHVWVLLPEQRSRCSHMQSSHMCLGTPELFLALRIAPLASCEHASCEHGMRCTEARLSVLSASGLVAEIQDSGRERADLAPLQVKPKSTSSPSPSAATTDLSYPTNGPSAPASAQTNGRHTSDRSDRDEVSIW